MRVSVTLLAASTDAAKEYDACAPAKVPEIAPAADIAGAERVGQVQDGYGIAATGSSCTAAEVTLLRML
jgi:hypothetical protein